MDIRFIETLLSSTPDQHELVEHIPSEHRFGSDSIKYCKSGSQVYEALKSHADMAVTDLLTDITAWKLVALPIIGGEVLAVSSDTVLTPEQSGVTVLVDSISSPVEITLPAPTSLMAFKVVNKGLGATVTGAVNGELNYPLKGFDSVTVTTAYGEWGVTDSHRGMGSIIDSIISSDDTNALNVGDDGKLYVFDTTVVPPERVTLTSLLPAIVDTDKEYIQIDVVGSGIKANTEVVITGENGDPITFKYSIFSDTSFAIFLTSGSVPDVLYVDALNDGYSAIDSPLIITVNAVKSLESVLEAFQREAINLPIPNKYAFIDGDGDGDDHIVDGGNDIYDAGMYFNTNIDTRIVYSNNVVTTEPKLGALPDNWFTSKTDSVWLGAASLDGSATWWSTSGGTGADGNGSMNLGDGIYAGYHWYIKRTFGTSDPSINYMVIVEDAVGITHELTGTTTDSDAYQVNGIDATDRLYHISFYGRLDSFAYEYSNAEADALAEYFITNVILEQS